MFPYACLLCSFLFKIPRQVGHQGIEPVLASLSAVQIKISKCTVTMATNRTSGYFSLHSGIKLELQQQLSFWLKNRESKENKQNKKNPQQAWFPGEVVRFRKQSPVKAAPKWDSASLLSQSAFSFTLNALRRWPLLHDMLLIVNKWRSVCQSEMDSSARPEWKGLRFYWQFNHKHLVRNHSLSTRAL